MRWTFIGLAAAATMVVAAASNAQGIVAVPNAPEIVLQRTAEQRPAAATKMYVVQVVGDPGISYQGGAAGLARTAPESGARYNSRASHVQQYAEYLGTRQDRILASVGARHRKVYSYRHAFNGFAAKLTEVEASKLRGNKEVLQVWEDRAIEIDTNNSPQFLGLLDRREGLRERLFLKGENVVVGVLDTGIVQEHPSFSDTRTLPLPKICEKPAWWNRRTCEFIARNRNVKVYGPPPRDWNGVCQTGEAWSESDCNNKLIGARWYVEGFRAADGSFNIVEDEFLSPRDSSGHGSHTASTAAGNEVTASLAGKPLAEISGMAPRARIAAYKVCWLAPNATNFRCFFSDSAKATDDAVADGVDVINFSVGTAPAFNDPQDLAFLDAVSAGVFVARSAGNEGPDPGTTAAGEPWVMSVGASTMDGTAFALAAKVNSPATVAGEYPSLEGVITRPLSESGTITADVVAADPIDACDRRDQDDNVIEVGLRNSIAGKIALIARGGCFFTEKIENAVNAGASAVLVYTTPTQPKTAMGGIASDLTLSIPGVMIDNAPGVALLAEVTAGRTVNAALAAGRFVKERLTGNIMADFSSRGPYATESDWIKPDITAPGVSVLAGSTPQPADGSYGDFFAYRSGTSMSSPHVAGLAALIRQAHPDWSPAAIKSALMTSARQDVLKEDGATAADPFDFGAGHVDPNKAVDPGLVYDADQFDYLAASCGTVSPLIMPDDCSLLEAAGFSLDPADLNLPSIGIGELPGSKTIKRKVTNVAKRGSGLYAVSVEAPDGFSVRVSPDRLFLHPGQTAEYEVTITNETAPTGEWRFGSLTWTETRRGYRVRSPIAVNAVAISAPDSITGTGHEGTAQFDVTFGYTGGYEARALGLSEALVGRASVATGKNVGFAYWIPRGFALARFELFDEYTSGKDDLDLSVFYCPLFDPANFNPSTVIEECASTVGTSIGATSRERVDSLFPESGWHLVFVEGFATEKGRSDFALFVNGFSAAGNAGNIHVMAPTGATSGSTGRLTVGWERLSEGPGKKQLGGIAHIANGQLEKLTIISIENDTGFGLGDLSTPPPAP
jgi:subtilisin family serine protease